MRLCSCSSAVVRWKGSENPDHGSMEGESNLNDHLVTWNENPINGKTCRDQVIAGKHVGETTEDRSGFWLLQVNCAGQLGWAMVPRYIVSVHVYTYMHKHTHTHPIGSVFLENSNTERLTAWPWPGPNYSQNYACPKKNLWTVWWWPEGKGNGG